MRTLPLLAVSILLVAGPLGAQNLLPNPNFDTDLSGWFPSSLGEWSSEDADSSPNSGSARVESGSFGNSGYYGPSVCLPVDEGEAFLLAYEALVPADQTRTGAAWLEYGFYPTLGCGFDGGSITGDVLSVEQTGSWTAAQRMIEAPEGAVAIDLILGNYVADDGEVPHVVFIDNVSLEVVPDGCVPDDDTLCLSNGRFAVETSWRTDQGTSGTGGTRALSDDTGTFWFFDEANTEVVVKVLDACSFSGHYWVFAGGLTNVEVDLVVTDTETEQVRAYRNELGAPFQPVQDTTAFATCP